MAATLGGANFARAEPRDQETAALTPGAMRLGAEGALPQPLKDADAGRYRRIFALEDQGRWAAADAEIARLGNKLLLGHVLAERYLSPRDYRASYAELSDWLSLYADLPMAPEIYRLAAARHPKGAKLPRRPEGAVYNISAASDGAGEAGAEWAGGLAAWRLRQYDLAAEHFERVAMSEGADSWSRAAGAYWAARGHLRAAAPQKVTHWLGVAANFPYTFYGILARKLSGLPADYNWEQPLFTHEDALQLLRTPQGARALALIEIGQDARAEQELRHINPAQPETAHALLAVTAHADMPSLAMQLAEKVVDASGRRYDGALYPVPSWQPQGGYTVDRALMLALIRQESKFSANATSTAGARGVMQLMPGTARFVADGTPYGGKRHELFDPPLNMALGQNYLAHLMESDGIRANLFLVVAAYNGGPGNVTRWQRNIEHNDDPLLFLEDIPSKQTRLFVEHVVANYWVYRDQLGQPTPALDAIAEGKWPTYNPQDGTFIPAAAKNGGH